MVMKRLQLNKFLFLGIAFLIVGGVALALAIAAPNRERGADSHRTIPTTAHATNQAVDDKPAPNFALTDMNGKTIHLSDFKGKVVVLNFWATWCPPCRKEIPDFIELQQQYKDKGLQFIGIALDEDGLAKVKPFVDASHITYPILLPNSSIAPFGEMNVIPVTYLIDRKGVLRTHYVGMRQKSVLEEMVRPLLAER